MRSKNLQKTIFSAALGLAWMTAFASTAGADTVTYGEDCKYEDFANSAVAIAVPKCGAQTVVCRANVSCKKTYIQERGNKDPAKRTALSDSSTGGTATCKGVMVDGKPSCDTSEGGAQRCFSDETTDTKGGYELSWTAPDPSNNSGRAQPAKDAGAGGR